MDCSHLANWPANSGRWSPLGRRPSHCVISPRILAHLAEAGQEAARASGLSTDDVDRARAAALRTLQIDAPLRTSRAGRLEVSRPQRQHARARRGRGAQLAALGGAAPRPAPVTIYDADHTEIVPGKRVRGPNDPATGSAPVDEAYTGLQQTLALYADQYGRNSYDNRGAAVNGTVRFGQDYDNAFWNGDRMIFGDGDGQYFNRFTIAVDS